jgi:hypothetical protein
MPRLTTVQTNFTAGEISPRALGRIDAPFYNNAAEFMENVIPLVQGGARRRDGLRFVAAAKFPDKAARVIPFVFSTTEAYVLEVGDQYIRFFKDGVPIAGPYEIATNLLESMLFDFDYAQGADTMIVTHQAVFPSRLRRFADNNWVYDSIPFDVQPFDEIGDSFANSLTLSAASVGAGRTATASAATFLNGDVGRTIYYQGGFATITAFTSSTQVTITITSAFPSVNVPASLWTLGSSPQETVTPGASDPIETVTTLTAAALNIWRSTDVGKFVRINGGLMQITGFTSTTVVQATIKEPLTGVVAAPKNSWSLESSVWSTQNGYPRACTFYQQRLVFGGSPAFPQTLWGSSTGAYLDFTLGFFDDDGFSYTLASDQINPIIHLVAGKVLFVLTYGGEFTVKGGVEKPVTPTNVQVDSQTAYGVAGVRPVRAGKDVIFAQRSLTKLRAMSYDIDTGEYDAPDLTVFAEHITQPAVKDLTYAQEPDPIGYAVRTDGVVATLTISPVQEVTAWARQVSSGAGGVIESSCTVPSANGDQTYCVVRRTVNGATVRYIERFDPSLVYSMDSAVVGASGPGTDVWSAAHLIGASVDCVADGFYMGRFTVSGGGTITLPRNAFNVVIGLPFRNRVKLLPPEVQTGTGSAQGNAMRTSEVSARFRDTYTCDVNGKLIDFAKFGGGLLGQAPQAFTGVKRQEELGWERGDSPLELGSDLPFPWHLLSVIRKFTVND